MSEKGHGVEYELKIKVDGEIIHSHWFRPDDPHLDRDLATMCWHARKDVERRGLKPKAKK